MSNCGCGNVKYNMIFACSGASDVGRISDLTARQLAQEKAGAMCCTAAIAAKIPDITEKARGATRVLAIDGCDKECARIILEQEGFNFSYLRLDQMGMKKGESPATEERMTLAMGEAKKRLQD